jgi:hypothetical protein
MGGAAGHIAKLKKGEVVQFRPRGNSMQGKIESGALVTVEPLSFLPKVGDIVLCKVRGAEYLHLVKAVKGERFQIGNNKGKVNGWVGLNSIYGRCVRVEW